MGQVFKICDLYLTAYLVKQTGVEPGLDVQKGKLVFVFPKDEKVYRALLAFNTTSDELTEYADLLKRFRGLIVNHKRNQHVAAGLQ